MYLLDKTTLPFHPPQFVTVLCMCYVHLESVLYLFFTNRIQFRVLASGTCGLDAPETCNKACKRSLVIQNCLGRFSVECFVAMRKNFFCFVSPCRWFLIDPVLVQSRRFCISKDEFYAP